MSMSKRDQVKKLYDNAVALYGDEYGGVLPFRKMAELAKVVEVEVNLSPAAARAYTNMFNEEAKEERNRIIEQTRAEHEWRTGTIRMSSPDSLIARSDVLNLIESSKAPNASSHSSILSLISAFNMSERELDLVKMGVNTVLSQLEKKLK